MNQSPTISVVILTNDRPTLLRKALTSLVHQTKKPHEVIIVNDSRKLKHETLKVIGEFQSLHPIIIRNTGHSIASGRSLGLAASHKTHVVYLDDDCEADRRYVERFVSHFEGKAAPHAVIGHIRNARPDNLYAAVQYAFYDRGIRQHFRDLTTPSPLCCGRMLDAEVLGIQKSVVAHAKFPERHSKYRNDDIDLGVYLLKRTCSVVFDPRIFAWSTPRLSLLSLWNAAFWNGFSDALTVHEYRINIRNSHYPLPFVGWVLEQYKLTRFRGIYKIMYVVLLASFPFVSRIGMVWSLIPYEDRNH